MKDLWIIYELWVLKLNGILFCDYVDDVFFFGKFYVNDFDSIYV